MKIKTLIINIHTLLECRIWFNEYIESLDIERAKFG